MGYLVKLINNDTNKTINNPNYLIDFLSNNFNLLPYFDAGKLSYFYSNDNNELTIFYSSRQGDYNELIIDNPNEEQFDFLVEIAKKLNDDSYIIGENGETFIIINGECIYKEINTSSNEERKFKRKDFLCRYIYPLIPLLIYVLIHVMYEILR